ncbi:MULTISPECIES: DUF565 domain-containing protein [unclassified Coleofasciculus]|uniref:DUF565 domain-containing protein n=1 Tax=unclassified Coleofasciculus TaxID=2692782 RepID=UPI00187F9B05|nr:MULTISPECIES: DUF565 domain-containing protein [unclassified Coleofasciculus]MBE9129085.1 DUF565 domain-containing protein [Coleofasciculus sp. LEGE 07081]MBE9151758.1 DUF565 domain-containing protein [Coleofasciculus sp. LEGE 07092]
MQKTRFTTLIDSSQKKIWQWLRLSWQWLSCLIISALLGFFCATIITGTLAQVGEWDILGAGATFLFAEIVSWSVYSRNLQQLQVRSGSPKPLIFFLMEVLNSFKLGLTFNLFLEAFRIAS